VPLNYLDKTYIEPMAHRSKLFFFFKRIPTIAMICGQRDVLEDCDLLSITSTILIKLSSMV